MKVARVVQAQELGPWAAFPVKESPFPDGIFLSEESFVSETSFSVSGHVATVLTTKAEHRWFDLSQIKCSVFSFESMSNSSEYQDSEQ